jgi:hypothetical protein
MLKMFIRHPCLKLRNRAKMKEVSLQSSIFCHQRINHRSRIRVIYEHTYAFIIHVFIRAW